MSLPAFYLPPEAWAKICKLDGEEARHAQVLRLKVGEDVCLLDGQGESGRAKITELGRREIRLELIERKFTEKPDSRPIIAIALSKAARRGFFLEKAAELGAWAVWLWQADRSQGRIDGKLAESCRAQLRAGAKQCHNPWFPELEILGDAKDVCDRARECAWRLLPWEAKAGEAVISLEQLGRLGDSVYAIGPEGGLSATEANTFIESGFNPVSLGERVLRCETAATLCLGLHFWASQLKAEKGAM